jgi:hypothetical protein
VTSVASRMIRFMRRIIHDSRMRALDETERCVGRQI